jgi:flagellar basal-body rod modification protein FlgD
MKEAGEAVVAVYDSAGNEVKRLFLGQQNAGTNSFKWDCTDINDETVSDGNYTYDVFVVGSGGYSKLDSSVKGEVTGVSYLNGKQYLELVPAGSTKTILVDPSTISAVGALSSGSSGSTASSDYTSYIGKTVTGTTGAVVAESGKATKGYFTLANDQSEVVVSIQNSSGSEIRRINLGSLDSGVHEIGWDGKNSSGEDATGRYVYKVLVKDSTGYSAIDPVLSGKVSGITYKAGYPYLELETDGAGTVEIDPASVTKIS